MILLWGPPRDTPLRMVRNALRRLGFPAVFLDQQAVLDTEVELSVGSEIKGTLKIKGTLRHCDQIVDLEAVTAVYTRPYDTREIPSVASAGRSSLAWHHALAVEDALWSWADLTPALVVNRPSAQATNSSKPYQAALIKSLGFEVPDTLITTDPEAAQEFWVTHETVVYKSISGIRSIVSRLGPEHLGRLNHVSWCPTQFQRYIPGTDYRVHVIGDEVFACEVASEATDYRYAARQGADVEIRACEIPKDCADQCRMLTTALGLLVAGVDLRRTPNGDWYCFEVNPSPGFTYYQEASNQPIDESIAQLLAAGSENSTESRFRPS